MTDKLRQQDKWNAEQISRAISYTASIFYNGRHNTIETDTLTEAIEMGNKMNDFVKNGRKAVVYAITPEGYTVWVCNPHQLSS